MGLRPFTEVRNVRESESCENRPPTIVRQPFPKVEAAYDSQYERKQCKENRGRRHHSEERPGHVCPAESRGIKHGTPASEVTQTHQEENEYLYFSLPPH